MNLASLSQINAPAAPNGAGVADPTAPAPAASSAGGAAVQPAVTVNLSDAAVAALATQGAPTPSAPAPTRGAGGVPAIVLQAQQMAGVIADGSTASDADKAAALAGLYKLRFSSGGYASGQNSWFAQSTQAQRDQINNTVDRSTFFKQAVSAAGQFNADGMAIARAGQSSDNAKTAHARFNQLSPGQQVLVWAGGASQFGSLEQYSAHLAQQADGAGSAAPTAATPATTASPPPSASSGQAYQSGQTGSQGSIVSLTA